jgi:hypothetical protein
MTSISQRGTIGSVASLLAAILYQGNPNRNHKLVFVLTHLHEARTSKTGFGQVKIMKEFV